MTERKKKEITQALLLLQEYHGNLSRTADKLNMSKATLMRWRDSYKFTADNTLEKVFKEKPNPILEKNIEVYATKKLGQCNRILDERDEWLNTLQMFREQLTEKNILKQDPRKLSEVFKLLHEAGTGESLDDKDKAKNSFYTVINQQILNQNNDE